MKPLVNLAQEPFRNRRLFWLLIAAIFAGSFYVWLNATGEQARLEKQIADRSRTVDKLVADAAATKKNEPAAITITPDKNRELVAASELIERRAFSWSQLLNDIERHIPANVRVLRIAVNKVRQNEKQGELGGEERTISLTLEVVGKSSSDVTAMITDFERTGVFRVNPLEKKVIDGMADVGYILAVEYTPPAPRRSRAGASNQIAKQVDKTT